jgi:DNA-binding MarR family transcriptional regulator/GNAT superfamily N-acetyltransferase
MTTLEAVAAEDVAQFRGFNRMWSQLGGLLSAGLLDSPFSLTEGRVIFELAQRGPADLAEVRQALALDAGYLTRIVRRLRSQGLVRSTPSPRDGRRQVLELTDLGRETFAGLDRAADEQASAVLAGFSPEARRRFVAGMRAISGVVGDDVAAGRPPYVIRPMRIGDPGWVIARHGVRYAEEYGWDATMEALVARIVAAYVEDHDPAREQAWIAEVDGEPVGCVFCVRKAVEGGRAGEDQCDETAQLRLLLVEPAARGLGIGSRLVDECVTFARRAGYRRMVLWTQSILTSAHRIYESKGFVLGESEPHRSFGVDLVGQFWHLEL